MEADNLKALKKASGHDVSASESDDDTDSGEETTSGPNIQPQIRQPEKNVKAKEAVKKRASAAAKDIAAKQSEDSKKPQESMQPAKRFPRAADRTQEGTPRPS
ncbi:hypothetical protein AAVH_30615 [Aphelenchoides avenae]|nr:hypothetical protein AAVH_30615 [Aphelenchus avenae]